MLCKLFVRVGWVLTTQLISHHMLHSSLKHIKTHFHTLAYSTYTVTSHCICTALHFSILGTIQSPILVQLSIWQHSKVSLKVLYKRIFPWKLPTKGEFSLQRRKNFFAASRQTTASASRPPNLASLDSPLIRLCRALLAPLAFWKSGSPGL